MSSLVQNQLASAARYFGTGYNVDRDDPGTSPTFVGEVETMRVAGGVRAIYSDILNRQPNHQHGIAPGSAYITLAFSPVQAQYRIGGKPIEVSTRFATANLFREDTEISGRYTAGSRMQGMSIQVNPDDLQDARIAEVVDTLMRSDAERMLKLRIPAALVAASALPDNDRSTARMLYFESGVIDLLAQLAESAEGSSPTQVSAEKKMALVRAIIMERPEEQHTIASLSQEVGLSMTALKSEFARLYGEPVFTFLRRSRIERAEYGLQHLGWSVKEAAANVGYGHVGNFTTAFKSLTGQTPAALRKRTLRRPQ